MNVGRKGSKALYAALTFVTVVVVFVGIFWPTALKVQLSGANADKPFQVPFSIENPSSVFTADDVTFYCRLINVESAQHVTLRELVTKATAVSIPPEGVAQKHCWLPIALDVRSATVEIVVERANYFFFSRKTVAGPFIWHPETAPPAWLEDNSVPAK